MSHLMQEVTPQRSFQSGRSIKAMDGKDLKLISLQDTYEAFRSVGMDLLPSQVTRMAHALDDALKNRYAQDAVLQPLITTPSVGTPIQFLQNFLPGFVHIVTAARKADQLMGLKMAGEWWMEQIVQGYMELVNGPVPYGDYTNLPYASWNVNYDTRTIVRFEQGLNVTNLEEARAAAMRVNSGASKRDSCGEGLEIVRNLIAMYGFNAGLNKTYGFLNDPSLPAYVTAAVGASTSTLWSTKTFQEITRDIRSMVAALETNTKDVFDPDEVEMTLGLASAVKQYLTVTTDLGLSVREWITQNYPKMRIVSAPELTAANGSANVAYLYADSIKDSSTDDGRTWDNLCQTKYLTQGVQQDVKGYQEGYLNAMAGALLKRAYLVYRLTGI